MRGQDKHFSNALVANFEVKFCIKYLTNLKDCTAVYSVKQLNLILMEVKLKNDNVETVV